MIMENEKKILEAGDVLVDHNRWQGIVLHKIDRTTAKTAHAGGYKFKREPDRNGGYSRIGAYGSLGLVNEKERYAYKFQDIKRWTKDFPSGNFQWMTDEQWVKVYQVFKEIENENNEYIMYVCGKEESNGK